MCILHGGADYIVERVLWFSVYSTKSQIMSKLLLLSNLNIFIAHAERDGTRAETRFLLSPKRTSPFKSVGASVQSTAGSRGVRISFSNAGYTTLGGGVRVLATHSIRQFPLQFPSRVSSCATRFRTSSTRRLQEVETPRFLDHTQMVRNSALRIGRLYPLRKYSWYSFLLEAVRVIIRPEESCQ